MERKWLSSYPIGAKQDIDLEEDDSLVNMFESSFQKYKYKTAFYNMGAEITYGELDKKSEDFANYLLQELKLKKGDRIALMMPNCLQYPVAFFGILRAGLVVVNVNPLYTPRELEHQLNDSGAKAILIMNISAHVLSEVIDKVKIEKVILTEIGDLMKFPRGTFFNFYLKYLKKAVPAYNLKNVIPFNTTLQLGSKHKFEYIKINLDEIALLQYTGGTTGVSKGAMLTHRNILSNVFQVKEWLRGTVREGEEVLITPLPLYHIFSLTANCILFSLLGGKNILITNPKDIPGFIKELQKHKFTSLTAVNTLFNALVNNEEFLNLDFSNFRLALGGGMACQEVVARRWKRATGIPIIEAYGLTETSPAACVNPLSQEKFNGKVGLPIPSTYVSFRDDDGNEVEDGKEGEIWIKGPQVMKGYWQREEETKKVLTDDGWLKTGDIGHIDEKGFVEIVDRKKDMIIVSGFNVYPNEIEEIAMFHNNIIEAAAVGVPDEKTGEAVKLFIVSSNESLDEKEVIEHCREWLTNYKVPKQITFRDELPKTNVGKILRRALRDDNSSESKDSVKA
jgi:long-chain acyl-CoA synthetase